MSAQERVAKRRTRLITAGRELLAETGWSAVSVRSVCAASGLADRYFYESFDGRDALLVAVCDDVLDGACRVTAEHLAAAETTYRGQVRAAADAVLELIESEPRLVRVLLLEAPDTPALNAHRRAMMASLVDLLVSATNDLEVSLGSSAVRRQLTAHAILGALFELLTAWRNRELAVSREHLLDFVVQIADSLAVPPAR